MDPDPAQMQSVGTDLSYFPSDNEGDLSDSAFQVEPGPPALSEGTILEVFAGSGNLSKAFRKYGYSSVKIEINTWGRNHDMSSRQVVNRIIAMINDKAFEFCHFAPPCNTYSASRYPRLRWAPPGHFQHSPSLD